MTGICGQNPIGDGIEPACWGGLFIVVIIADFSRG